MNSRDRLQRLPMGILREMAKEQRVSRTTRPPRYSKAELVDLLANTVSPTVLSQFETYAAMEIR